MIKMELKKNVIGSKVFVKGFGFNKVTEANKQFFFNKGFKELFEDDVKDTESTVEPVNGDTKRTKKRGKSE